MNSGQQQRAVSRSNSTDSITRKTIAMLSFLQVFIFLGLFQTSDIIRCHIFQDCNIKCLLILIKYTLKLLILLQLQGLIIAL